MTRDEALEAYRQSYAQYGKSLGAEEMADFDNAYRQSAEGAGAGGAGLSGARSLESIMGGPGGTLDRARERFMPTSGRIVDSQSSAGEALYGGDPSQRYTSGSRPGEYLDTSTLGGFTPFAAGMTPQMLQSIFSQMGPSGKGQVKPLTNATSYAPNYTYSGQGQQGGQANQQTNQVQGQTQSNRYQTNTQRTAGQTTAMGAQPNRGRQKSTLGISGPTVRSKLNSSFSGTGLGLT